MVRKNRNEWMARKEKKTDVQLAKEQIFTRMRRRFLEKIKVQNVAGKIKKLFEEVCPSVTRLSPKHC